MKTWGDVIDEVVETASSTIATVAPPGVAGSLISAAFSALVAALRNLADPDTVVDVVSGDGSPAPVVDNRK